MQLLDRVGAAARIDLRRGNQLSADEIDEMYQLRAELIAFKEDADLQSDREAFERFVGGANSVLTLRSDGRIDAMFSFASHDGVFDSVRYRLIIMEYAFARQQWRGHPLLALAYLRAWMHTPSWDPRVQNFLGGVGYLRSAMRLVDIAGAMWVEGDSGLSALQEHVLKELRTHFPGESGCAVKLPTKSAPPPDSWVERYATRPEVLRYTARVPNWSDGYGLPYIVPASPLRASRGLGPLLAPLLRGRRS